jgi:tRNA modification GTPase
MGDDVVLVMSGDSQSQTIEVQSHGGPGIIDWLLALAQRLGCRQVGWEEWLGSDSPSALLPYALTKRTAAILLDQAQGAFDQALAALRRRFDERPYEPASILHELDQLQRWEDLGRHLVTPWRIVLAGPANVGKSTLFNALLGFERAITSPQPGTTRDVISATLAWKGYPLEVVDTAGIRGGMTPDELEQAGIDRSLLEHRRADLVLWLIDLSEPGPGFPPLVKMRNEARTLLLGAKADLPHNPVPWVQWEVSAQQGTGLNDLMDAVLRNFLPEEPTPGQPMPVTAEQRMALADLRMRILRACENRPPA